MTTMGDDFGVKGAVGTGPFKLDSFAIGLETVLVRNDDYAWASDLSENQGAAISQRSPFARCRTSPPPFLSLKTGGFDLLLGVPTPFLEILKGGKQCRRHSDAGHRHQLHADQRNFGPLR